MKVWQSYNELIASSDSILEREFWCMASRRWNFDFADVRGQLKAGRYRCDAGFRIGGEWVAIELDGTAYHDQEYDSHRDQWILANTDVKEIVRIPYAAMTYFPEATFSVLESWHPTEFEMYAVEYSCLHEDDFMRWLEKPKTESFPFDSIDDYLEYAHVNNEVWSATESTGWAQSPKAYLQNWNTKPIKRTTR